MAGSVSSLNRGGVGFSAQKMTEPLWVRSILIFLTFAFLGIFLFVPLVSVFVNAFSKTTEGASK